MFSVVIPTCNRLDALMRCVRSVVNQIYSADEIIICCNGTEQYYQIVLNAINKKYPDHNIIVEQLISFIGVSAARNAGVTKATCNFIAFIDDDDLWNKYYLHKAHQAILHDNNSDAYISGIDVYDKNHKIISSKMLSPQTADLNILYYKNPGFGGSNIIIKKASFYQAGQYNTSLRSGEDKALLIEGLKQNWTLSYVKNNAIEAYTNDQNSLSRNKWHRMKANLSFLRTYGIEMGIKNIIKNLIKILLIFTGKFK